MIKPMTVGRLRELLSGYPESREICMTSRVDQGTSWTCINHVGDDPHGNLVVTFSDKLLKRQVIS